MATVKVAVRVRPFNQRELDQNCQRIIEMEDKKTRIINTKIPVSFQDGDLGRERIKEFSYDYSYWSFDSRDENYVPQEQVFEDLGTDVVDSAFEGYNACVFAYGQTGSGKTHTMMGTPDAIGLIPRICQKMFEKMKKHKNPGINCRTEISYLEIYNEKVKDLLKNRDNQHPLRVREHPRQGPYVEELSKHFVMDYSDIHDLMMKGNALRSTASTNMNDVSSRSHAIFTITFVQAKFDENTPSETVSKVNLVDLAGSERADITGATGQRLKEGGHINKSLVTLGSVISALADLSSSSTKGKPVFIPYRDSVLTWLLKDSLGGNSKTIMIATVSPADCNYGETLSTLRYANRAKNIINKPTINEDPNVKLIRELRSEIARLHLMIAGNQNSNFPLVKQLHANEEKVKVLTEAWTERWKETQKVLEEQQNLALRKSGVGVILDSDMPHLVGIDDNVLSTGITFYPLKEGITSIGGETASQKQDIVLAGLEPEHCRIELVDGQAFLIPLKQSPCHIDGTPIDIATRLTHGCVLMLGKMPCIMFRYNNPAEAARLRKEQKNGSNLNLSRFSFLSFSSPDLLRSTENLSFRSETDENGNGDFLKVPHSSPPDLRDKFLEKIHEENKDPLSSATEFKIIPIEVEIESDVVDSNEEINENVIIEEVSIAEKLKIKNELEKEIEDLKLKKQMEMNNFEELKRKFDIEVENTRIKLDEERLKYCNEKQIQEEVQWQLLKECERDSKPVADVKSQKVPKNDEYEKEINQIRDDLQEIGLLLGELYNVLQQITIENCSDKVQQELRQRAQTLKEQINFKNEMILQLQEKISGSDNVAVVDSMQLEKASFELTDKLVELNEESERINQQQNFMNVGSDGSEQETFADEIPLLQVELHKTGQKNACDKENLTLDLMQKEHLSNNEYLLHLAKELERQVDNPEIKELSQYLKMSFVEPIEGSSSSTTLKIIYLQALTEKYKQMERELDLKFQQLSETNLSAVPAEDFAQLEESLMVISKSTEKLSLKADSTENILSGYTSPSRSSDSSQLSPTSYRTPSHHTLMDVARVPLDEVCKDVYFAIPCFIMLGSGKTKHHEYEIKLMIKHEAWTLFRRYKRFRELHKMMADKFQMEAETKIPPKCIFGNKSDAFAEERRKGLEKYLHCVLRWCFTAKESPLYEQVSREALCNLIPFFRKGIYDSNKLQTG